MQARVEVIRWLSVAFLLIGSATLPAEELPTVPPEVASTHFVVSVNGTRTPVLHAAVNDYFLNFDMKKHVTVSITADRDDFWSQGVEVQPWRLGIRPKRDGRTITFKLDHPAKISISRPGDFLGDAEMLYLFASAPDKKPPQAAGPGLRYFGPGVHRENIDAVSGDTIYLAPGAVVFGALNIWGVERVRVFGRGVIVYDGPQNPADDDGWMHKKNWHCIVMDHAKDISIEGITCVVRSRTWQIQMKDSRGVRFDNIKVIGANTGNANADGMDWLGGGDTVVKDSFFRAADDIFAMQGSWEGYGPKAFAVEGSPVTNVTVEDSVLSTSISNVVRAGWPEKNFEGGHFLLRNSDVLHMGIGGCGIPFALMELWADPNGRGRSGDFRFENIRLEEWYSLVQAMEPVEGVSGIEFKDVFGLELPSLVPSVLKGSVHGVVFDNVNLGGVLAKKDEDVPVEIKDVAAPPVFAANGPDPKISFSPGWLRPGQKVSFEAQMPAGGKGLHYEWSFGDGTRASGRKVKHTFPDAEGTLWDGSGRFRVLLHVIDATGRNGWAYAPLVVRTELMPASDPLPGAIVTRPGLQYRYTEAEQPELLQAAVETIGPADGGSNISEGLDLKSIPHREENYSLAFDGYLSVPADGGYSVTLLSNDAGQISVDGHLLGKTPAPFAQVCGMRGNAVRSISGSMALAKGQHRISVSETHMGGQDGFRVFWQGPGIALGEIPAARLSHTSP